MIRPRPLPLHEINRAKKGLCNESESDVFPIATRKTRQSPVQPTQQGGGGVGTFSVCDVSRYLVRYPVCAAEAGCARVVVGGMASGGSRRSCRRSV